VEGTRAPPWFVMNQINNGNENIEEGGVGTIQMTLDLSYRKEDVEFLVNKAKDDGKDSNSHGRSLLRDNH